MGWGLERLGEQVLLGQQIRRDQHLDARDAEAEVAHLAVRMSQARGLGLFHGLCLTRMLVVVVAEMLRGNSGLVPAVPGRRGPGELQRQHDQQQVDEDASHEASVSSVERIATLATFVIAATPFGDRSGACRRAEGGRNERELEEGF